MRRPSASDRDIVDAICRLDTGCDYRVQIIGDARAHLKPEGGMMIDMGDKKFLFIPEKKK